MSEHNPMITLNRRKSGFRTKLKKKLKHIFSRKHSSSNTSTSSPTTSSPTPTPFYKKVTRAIVNKFRPKPPVDAEVAFWTHMLPLSNGSMSRYRLTSLINDTVFPGSAIIDGNKMTAHISLITEIYDDFFYSYHFVQGGISEGSMSITDMGMSPKSCCLTYIGDQATEVRANVLNKLRALRLDKHDRYSYSYKELCKIIIRMSCKETNPDKLNEFAKKIKDQNEIICSGIFLHVYMETFSEMKIDISKVFPLNPFACTPARILDVLKTNEHWDVVPLKLLLLVGPLTIDIDKKQYNEYASEVNCSLITKKAETAVQGVNVFYDKYLPGIYDNKAKQVLLKPLQIYAKK